MKHERPMAFLLPLLVCLAPLSALAPVPAAPYLEANASVYRQWIPGVLRPDAGTLEVTVVADRPSSELGNGWEFLFACIPVKETSQGANTLMGAFLPPEPEKGLSFLLRTGKSYWRVNVTNFMLSPGKKVNLAFTWGSALTVYVNGSQVGRVPIKDTPEEAWWPDQFRMNRFGPWNPKALKISTIEKRADELDADPETPFSADDQTSLLTGDGLARSEIRSTRWLEESSYAVVKPVYRMEKTTYRLGEKPVFPVVAVNRGRKESSAVVKMTMTPFSGAPALSQQVRLSIPPASAPTVFELPLAGCDGADYYRIKWAFEGAGVPGLEGSGEFLVYPKDAAPVDGALSRFYGVHNDEDASADLFAKLGVRNTRAWAGGSVFLWNRIEPVKGNFRWEAADAYVKEAREKGMDILAVLGYPSRWAAAPSPEELQKKHPLALQPARWKPADLAAWARYVRETVTRYRKDVKYWEIYNEVNFHPPGLPATFSGSTEEYFELMKIAWKEIKAVDPSCQVLTSGFSTEAELTMPAQLLKMGIADLCDIFNVHGYAGRVEGPAVWVDDFKKRRPGAPYWQTEHMWHELFNMPRRYYLTAAYPLQYAGAGYGRFFNMGVQEVFFSRHTMSPRLDQWIIGVMANELRPCEKFAGKLAFPGDHAFDMRHSFTRSDASTLTVLGSENGAHEVAVAGNVGRVRELFGRKVPVVVSGGESIFEITNLVYLVHTGPLVVKRVKVTSEVEMYVNGGIEDVDGDIGMAGLKAGKPRGFIVREKTFDPEGVVQVSDKSRAGRFAMRVATSGKGRVYFFQYVMAPAAGTYVLSGWFRKDQGGGDVRPYMFFFDQDRNKVDQKLFEDAGSEWKKFSFEFDLPAKSEKTLAVGWGVQGGAGEVTIDDVAIERKK
jgi:hypothetical protein